MAGKTLYDKLWDSHLVQQRDDGSALIYIDLQLLHEVTSPQAFEAIPIWSDPLTCVVSKDHPLAQNTKISLIDLAQYPCVLPNKNTFTRQIAEQVFGKQDLKPQVRMNTNNLETLAMLVSIGWGWSLLPSTMVDDRLCVLNFPDLNVERKLGVLHHKQKTLSRAASAFIQLLKNDANSTS